MNNIFYFLKRQHRKTRGKTAKVSGVFLVAIVIFLWSFSATFSSAATKEVKPKGLLLSDFDSLLKGAFAQIVESLSTSEPSTLKEAVSQPQPKKEETASVSIDAEEERDKFERGRELAELKKWKKDRLREFRNILSEIGKVRRQLARLKGTASGIAELDNLKQKATECGNKLSATADDSETLRDILEGEECGDTGEVWQEIERIRTTAELPRDIDNISKDLKRIQSQLKQKWVCKIVDCNKFKAVIANMEAQLAEAKRLQGAGEIEDARVVIQETFHDKGWFGDAMGAVQMMREITEPLSSVKNKELKSQIEDLIAPVKDMVYEGEVRQARQAMEEIKNELGPVVLKKIMQSGSKTQTIPESILDKLEQLKQKYGETGESIVVPEKKVE